MTLKGAISVAGLSAALLTMSAPSAGAIVSRKACLHARGDTIAQGSSYKQGSSYRIYQRTKYQPKKYYTSITTAYACRLNTIHLKQKRIEVWRNNLDGTSQPVGGVASGRYGLIVFYGETGVSEAWWLIVADLQTGKKAVIDPTDDSQQIGNLFVTGHGGALATYSPDTPLQTLHAIDATGDHLLASGDFSDPAAAGSTAYWIQGGTIHSYTFVGNAVK